MAWRDIRINEGVGDRRVSAFRLSRGGALVAGASPVLAIQVISEGQLLYDSDEEARGRFEDRIFSAYARLNEERRGILERIAAEGTVYGR